MIPKILNRQCTNSFRFNRVPLIPGHLGPLVGGPEKAGVGGSRDPFPRGKAIIRSIEQKGVSERNLPGETSQASLSFQIDLVSCFG